MLVELLGLRLLLLVRQVWLLVGLVHRRQVGLLAELLGQLLVEGRGVLEKDWVLVMLAVKVEGP